MSISITFRCFSLLDIDETEAFILAIIYIYHVYLFSMILSFHFSALYLPRGNTRKMITIDKEKILLQQERDSAPESFVSSRRQVPTDDPFPIGDSRCIVCRCSPIPRPAILAFLNHSFMKCNSCQLV